LDRSDAVTLDIDRIPIEHFDLRRVNERAGAFFLALAVLLEVELQNPKRVI
jgi:hypothetical protein